MRMDNPNKTLSICVYQHKRMYCKGKTKDFYSRIWILGANMLMLILKLMQPIITIILIMIDYWKK